MRVKCKHGTEMDFAHISGYVYRNDDGAISQSNPRGRQICSSGGYRGSTMMASNDTALKSEVKTWIKNRARNAILSPYESTCPVCDEQVEYKGKEVFSDIVEVVE